MGQLAFTAAWVEWRRVKNVKRQKDMIFWTQFLTDEPEVVRRQILGGIDSLKQHLGVNVIEKPVDNIDAQVQVVQREMEKLKRMIADKKQKAEHELEIVLS